MGSNPIIHPKDSFGNFFLPYFAGMAELADAPDLGSGSRECRFKSCYPHVKSTVFAVLFLHHPDSLRKEPDKLHTHRFVT